MPIQSNLGGGHAFSPEQLAMMKTAFDAVWEANAKSVLAGQNYARDAIALAIIETASRGPWTLDALIAAGTAAIRYKAQGSS